MSQPSMKSAPLVLALLAAGVVGGAGVEALHNTRASAAPLAQVAAVAPSSTPAAASRASTSGADFMEGWDMGSAPGKGSLLPDTVEPAA